MVATLAKAPAAVLWTLGGLLAWFAKGLWQYRRETAGRWNFNPAPDRSEWREFSPQAAQERLRRLYR